MSVVGQRQSAWVDGLTIWEALETTVQRYGDREALVFPQLGYRADYTEFRRQVAITAKALIAMGVEPGEHVGLWATNWPQWVIVQFATASIGSPLVNVNPAYRLHELEYVLNQAEISTLIVTNRFKSSDYYELLQKLCPELAQSKAFQCSRCPRLRRLISIKESAPSGILPWDAFLKLADKVSDQDLSLRKEAIGCGDVVNLQYTSGTTGFPKGVQLTHRNLLMNAYYVGARMKIGPSDRVCIPVPFYHCFGCVMGTLMCSIYGAAMVIPAEVFDPARTLLAIQNERCSAIYGVPSMFIAELDHPDFKHRDLSSLRTGIMAGSPCPIEIMKRVAGEMGASEITIAYGLTEASPVITQTSTDDSLENRVTTVGKPLPELEVRIVHPETGRDAEPGQQGELMVRGHGVMKGYYKNPKETAAAVSEEGWLRSGDLATRRPDGFYRITGRLKDMVIRGGENIYPREIEEFLYTHPDIADVQVVGLPDPKYGEELSAWIVPRPGRALTEDDVRQYCEGRISHFKIPRYVVFIDDYPKTVTGKVQKFRLREMGIEKFRLAGAADTA